MVMGRLLIFLKYPLPGRVKTRLAEVIGHHVACDVYRTCSELTLERLNALHDQITLYVSPPEALTRIRQWVGPAWMIRVQQGRTLGKRLAQATQRAFAEGATRVVVIGTDSPWLVPADIAAAFNALEQADVVVGPTEDGGYYLIGLSKPVPELFDGVAWSSPRVYVQTVANAQALSLSVHELPRGYDLDHLEDVERFLEEERGRGPLTAAVQVMQRIIQGTRYFSRFEKYQVLRTRAS